ncbi:MAG: rhodanese-related sulfurtransferase [Isosphaeraceae bacterium]|nr:rhodanese-related sulfurtransferase [Isosphaeraceae bacterium]
MSNVVVALYHFFDFPDFAARRSEIRSFLESLEIGGTLLLSPEGINGTLAGSARAIDACVAFLRDRIIHSEFDAKLSRCDRPPFQRLKVRLKRETISLGEPVDPVARTGIRVDGARWNALLDDPEVVVVDARNRYEIHLGRFPRALDPGTRTFKELPGFVRSELDPERHRKIATYCTGGIRCEKFSAWLLEKGFVEVYQLEGGILRYLETIPAESNRWEGECYVFDERVAVGPGLVPSATATICRACGHALTPEDRADSRFVPERACPHCVENAPRRPETDARGESAEETCDDSIKPSGDDGVPRGS